MGFDTEDDSKSNVHLLCFYGDDEEKFTFYDKDTALYWLYTSDFDCDDLILWCVNTQYDVVNLNRMIDRPYLTEIINNKSQFVFAQLYLKQNIKFYDAMNFYSVSAEKVGEMFGLKKLHFDFDKRTFNKDGSVRITKKEITYCLRDAKICYKAGKYILSKFKDFDIRRTPTVASCALQIYLKHYSPIDFTQFNINKNKVNQKDMYSAYCGGRVEAFHYGKAKGQIKYYDVNSLYPSVMRDNLFPDVFSRMRKTKDVDNVDIGFFKGVLKAPKMHVPILPIKHYKTAKDYKLLFPTGILKGCWTMAELQYALDNGYTIEEVDYCIEYEHAVDLFSSFVNDMYRMRLEAKYDYEKNFYKINMNGVYGKFAEKRRYTSYIPIEEASIFNPIVFDKAQVERSFYPQHNYTIISAYVTSYARIKLHKYMMDVVNAGYNLMYCDTDSIIYQGKRKLWEDSKELGEMKIEDSIKHINILGAKYYMYTNNKGDKKYTCKGVPKQHQKEMFDTGQATFKKPNKLRESIRRNLIPNFWNEMTRHDRHIYDKRKILKDGHSTKALHFKLDMYKTF